MATPRWRRRADNTMSLMAGATVLMTISNAGVLEFGTDDEGKDFKLFGATASAFMLWDASLDKLRLDLASLQMGDNDELRFGDLAAGDVTLDWDGSNFLTKAAVASSWLIGEDATFVNITLKGTLTVGKDDIGNDVQLFGATAGAHLLWDESADTLKLVGGAKIDAQGTLTVGVDDTGYDVQFFGATAGLHLLWDESADQLKLVGDATMDITGILTHHDEVVHGAVVKQTKSANYTMDLDDSGHRTYIDTDAFVITLPATVVGLSYTFVNAGADGAVLIKISPNSSDYIAGANLTKVDNKALLNTKTTAKKGDMVTIVGDGVNGWYITELSGTWAKEA